MRKALLLYNPHSGPRPQRNAAAAEQAAHALRAAGVEAAIAPILSPAAAARQARDALAHGNDAIFACGGDGTVQDVAQGLVGTNAALALIPLGTANVLAHDLGFPRDPAAAARSALTAVPLRIAVGQVQCQSLSGAPLSKYFLSVVGAGMDAYLFHRLERRHKETFGIAAYCAQAFYTWLGHRARWFPVHLDGEPQPPVTQLLAVRLADFGNVLRTLAPGASLLRNDLRVVLFHSSSRWAFLRYVLRGIVRASWNIPGIELRNATRIACGPPPGADPVYIEADGELLGTLPAEISIIPNALTLLAANSCSKTKMSS